jgi:hypothetical protein
MAEIESRSTYFTELASKRIHFFLQTGGVGVPALIPNISVWILKNGVAINQIVTPGGGERIIVDRTRGHYEMTLLAADLDTDGALTLEIDVSAGADSKVLHLKLDQRGGQRTV